MRLSCFAALALGVSTVAAHASPTTYNFNLPIGSASAVGTITTDGNYGVLTSADILSYTIKLSNGSTSVTQGTGSYSFIDGVDTTATAQGLFYNFSATDYSTFSLNPNGSSFLCLPDAVSSCTGNGYATPEIDINGLIIDGSRLTGVQEFATAATSVTPEPSSLALLGTGLLGLVGAARKRFA